MLKRIALVALLAIWAICLPAMAEPGDPPSDPRIYMTPEEVHAMEQLRWQQAVGGVTGSPYWLYQAFLCGESLQLRLYEVTQPLFPEQLLFKERIFWAKDGTENKRIVLTVEDGTSDIELRLNREALEEMAQSRIISLKIQDRSENELAYYQCEEMTMLFDFFRLTNEETLCIQGADKPVYALSAEGVKRTISGQ